ncbi:MAG: FkbM family methyltransferase [Desulfobulbia bacterium]
MNETFVRKIIEAIEPTHDVAMDIGANHGSYTDALCKKFASVHAFEPLPNNMKVLHEKVTMPNVRLHQMAIGKVNGNMKLYTCPNHGGNSISEKVGGQTTWGHDKNTFVTVESQTLDHFCRENDLIAYKDDDVAHKMKPRLRFIKCDIEGAEDFIFDYGKEVLSTNRLDIMLEVHQTVDTIRLYNFFKELGYTIYNYELKTVEFMTQDHHYLITNTVAQ